MSSMPLLAPFHPLDATEGSARPSSSTDPLLTLISDWYWELDTAHRLKRLIDSKTGLADVNGSTHLGKAFWQMGWVPLLAETSWSELQSAFQAREPFVGFSIKNLDPIAGDINYVAISGHPHFDENGCFCGYRGISTRITQMIRNEQLLKLEHNAIRSLMHATESPLAGVVKMICEMELWNCGAFWRLTDTGEFELCDFVASDFAAAGGRDQYLRCRTSAVQAAAQTWTNQPEHSEPRWFNNVTGFYDLVDGVDPFNSSLQFPLIVNDVVRGIFDFVSVAYREPDAALLEAVTSIATQIGFSIERNESEHTLRESEERFRSLVKLSSDWYWRQNARHEITEIVGKHIDSAQQLVGKTLWDNALAAEVLNMTLDQHVKTLDAHLPFRDLIVRYTRLDGSSRYSAISGEPVFTINGVFDGYRGLAKDITAHKQDEARIQYLATHDELTGLSNRSHFSEILAASIKSAERHDQRCAVLFIDLDRFKNINDTLGHEAGDHLLKEMAQRLKHVVRTTDTVARLGGDEFVVLMQQVARDDDIAKVARKILSNLIAPIELQGQECRVTASIGISRFPDDASSDTALMKNADIAMYRAKDEGKNNFQFYSDSIKAHSLERLSLETSLRRALERREFLLHYQAKLDLKADSISGVEALLRWQHPELGLVAPAQFIPLAEETGLIVPIGRWVLHEACRQHVAWREAGVGPMRIAINLSARQFSEDRLVDDIAHALQSTGIDGQWLELELTESMVMHNHQRAIRMLTQIKEMGVRIAIDDFGVGYSSLAQIKRFPIDTLKVDRAFIRDLPHNAEDRAITQAVIAMGKTLSLTVVAEGVETREQEQFLRDNACDETQGFYFGKPISADEFTRLHAKNLADSEKSNSSAQPAPRDLKTLA